MLLVRLLRLNISSNPDSFELTRGRPHTLRDEDGWVGDVCDTIVVVAVVAVVP